jgi:hypothetical protein
MAYKALNRLLCAALVSTQFRTTLLSDPAGAIDAGYYDQRFSLTTDERKMVVGLQANTFEEFCVQVYDWISIQDAKKWEHTISPEIPSRSLYLVPGELLPQPLNVKYQEIPS